MKVPVEKDRNIEIRVTQAPKELLSRAAELLQASLCDFVRTTALEAAQAIVDGHSRFTMSQERWKAFCEALEAPPRDLPGLSAFLRRPSVFDENG